MTPPYTQEDIDDALTAMIAFAGNSNEAVRYLEAQGINAPTQQTL